MGSSSKIAHGVIWTVLYNVFNGLYGFVAVPILIKYFGKTEFGLIGLAMSVNVYMQLMDMGFSSTNVRFYSAWLAENNEKKVNRAFQTSLGFYGIVGIINGLIVVVIAFFADSIFNVTPEQAIVLRRLLCILAVTSIGNWFISCFDQLVRATENVAWVERVKFIPKILHFCVLIITVLFDFSLELFYVLFCFATMSTIPFLVNKVKRGLKFVSLRIKIDKATFKEMLPYSLNILSFSIFQFSFLNLRPVFLGIRGTLESVTDYSVLSSISSFVQVFAGAFLSVLIPSASKVVAQHNMDAYYRVAYEGTRYISIVLCFIVFGMITVGANLLSIYVGDSFLFLVPWLTIWLVCNLSGHNQAISSLIFSGADIRILSYTSAVSAILGLLASWFLIPNLQVGGAVIGLLVYSSVQMGVFYVYYWPHKMKISSWRVFCKSFVPYVIIGFISFLLCQLIPLNGLGWMNFFILGFSFTLLYGTGMVGLFKRSDFIYLKSLIISSKSNR